VNRTPLVIVSTIAVTLAAVLGFVLWNNNQNHAGHDMMNMADGDRSSFAAMMIPHHEQAVKLAELALEKSNDARIIALANEIIDAQNSEIALMKTWTDSDTLAMHSGHMMGMDGMLSDEQMSELRNATSDFDRLFLTGMIAHHEGAIDMAEMYLPTDDIDFEKLLNDIVAAQSAEISEMNSWLAEK
jgi:uncharacterized protein (DUF305 family)